MHPQADTDTKSIIVTPLAPTFGAEVTQVDFSKPIPRNVFDEIEKAIAKVRIHA